MLLFGSGSPWRLVEDTVTADGLRVGAEDTKIMRIFGNRNRKSSTRKLQVTWTVSIPVGKGFLKMVKEKTRMKRPQHACSSVSQKHLSWR